jgi:hypothetical protein
MSTNDSNTLGPLEVLRRRPQPPSREQRCDMCGEVIGDRHRHVVDLDHRRLLCTCPGCGLLFIAEGAGCGRYRAVPDRFVELATGPRALALWEALEVPVGVVFFVSSSRTGRVSAFYPGPAGATESLLALGSWQQALFAAGLARQLRRTDLPAAVRSQLIAAQRTLWTAIEATRSMANTELWTWKYADGHYRIRPFGSSNSDATEADAAQLWSTVYLAIKPPAWLRTATPPHRR